MWYAHGMVGGATFRYKITRIDELEPLLEECEPFFTSGVPVVHSSAAVEFDTRTALG